MRPLGIVLAFAASSCSNPPPAPAVLEVPPPSAPAPSASASAAASVPIDCAHLGPHEVRRARALIAEALAKEKAEGAGVEDPPAFVGKCFPTPEGAWITTVHAAGYNSGYGGLELRWAIEHVAASGGRETLWPTAGDDNKVGLGVHNYASHPDTFEITIQAFDYDGDRTPELLVGINGHYHEGPDFSVGRIYTLKGGKIERYAPAAGIAFAEIRDVDGDGLPDLLHAGPFSSVLEYCGSGFGYRVQGPMLVAHARPGGTFDARDAVAVGAARKACPARPAGLVDKKHVGEVEPTARNLACARLWGVSTADLQRRIKAECKMPPSKEQCPQNPCGEPSVLEKWAAITPPLVLE